MSSHKIKIVFFFLISLIVSSCFNREKILETDNPIASSFEETDEILITWITEAWPNFTQENGEGVYHDLINAVFSSQGIQVEVTYAPWKRCAEEVRTGNFDMTGGIESSSDYYQSKYPVYEYTDLIVYEKGKFQWEGVETLKDKRGAWVRGYLTNDSDHPILPYAEGEEFTSFSDLFLFFQSGRADYVLTGIEAYINHTAQIEDFDRSRYEKVYLTSGQLYFSFPRNERGLYVRDLYDAGVERLSQEEINRIYGKWDLDAPFLDLR